MIVFPKRYAPFVYLVWVVLAVAFAVSGLWIVDLFFAGWVVFWLGIRAAARQGVRSAGCWSGVIPEPSPSGVTDVGLMFSLRGWLAWFKARSKDGPAPTKAASLTGAIRDPAPSGSGQASFLNLTHPATVDG